MLKKENAIGIMIDMQEKLVPSIAHGEELTKNCALFLAGLKALGVPFAATQQYTRGLGATLPELRELTDNKWIEKSSFSCMKEPAFVSAVESSGAKQIMVFGTETHICVQQTVLELLEKGYEVYLIADCAGSRFDSDREIALRRMEKAGAVLTTFEAALFELCEVSGTDAFKAISKLVKMR